MRTRSRSRKPRSEPYPSVSISASASPIMDSIVPRLFLVTECEGGNGWVVQADTPQEALTYYQRDILKIDKPSPGPGSDPSEWSDYLTLETSSEADRPFYMQVHNIGTKQYFVESLTFPGHRTAWIPTSFN